jgi:hypothetical protein
LCADVPAPVNVRVCMRVHAGGTCSGPPIGRVHAPRGSLWHPPRLVCLVPVECGCVRAGRGGGASCRTCKRTRGGPAHVRSPLPTLPVRMQVLPKLLRFLDSSGSGSGVASPGSADVAAALERPCSPPARFFGPNLRFLTLKEFDWMVSTVAPLITQYGCVWVRNAGCACVRRCARVSM